MFDSYSQAHDLLARIGVVETHYHVGPELVARRYDVQSLAEAARPFGAALVLKNHTFSTTPLAALARARHGVRFYGGVVLNSYVGGLNPAAVSSAVSGNKADVQGRQPDDAPIVVWMPTVDAVSHVKVHGFGFDPNWSGCCGSEPAKFSADDLGGQRPVVVFAEDLRPMPELIEVLKTIARHNCVLATGHLSAAEVMQLVPLAISLGVKRVIVTHPHYPSVGLTDDQLCALVKHDGVYVEHCFAIHTQDGVQLEAFADSIRATGHERVLLSTDFGQVNSDTFPAGTVIYALELGKLLRGAMDTSEFLSMFSANGFAALGIEQ
ncbi:DUF6282 family protein [Variovorax sp. GB1R11]|uniref:DUF6282 family protein n=1 Tax=Variovorax sp. GB1R11 TaxID=3443741 RepID=UPI003F47036A